MPVPSLSLAPSTSLAPGYGGVAPGGALSIALSSRWEEAVRSGGTQWAEVDAYRAGVRIASDLPVVGGSATDDSSPGVRRLLDLQLAPEPGLFDLLAPTGTQLVARSVLRYPDGTAAKVQLGVFEVDVQRLGYAPGGDLSITAPDKWLRVQRARFVRPQASTPGMRVAEQIAVLIRGALGQTESVVDNSGSSARVGRLLWEQDRDKAIIDLADSIGCYVSFNRSGVATIDPLPTLGTSSSWTVDARENGVLLSADRSRDRQRTYNVVVAASDRADGTAPFTPQVVWDTDPTSATYAGPDPVNRPDLAGPFGVVPYFYSSPLLESATQARSTASTILARVTGLNAQLSLTAVRNPALDALNVIDVLLPQVYGEARVLERHIVDKVTHPLTVDGTQQIDTRSTRTDAFS